MCIPISPDFHDISAALLPPTLLPPRSLARALARSSSTVSPTAAIDVLFSHRNLHECMSGGIPHAISHISMLFTISFSLHGYFTVYCIIIVIIIYISTFYMDI